MTAAASPKGGKPAATPAEWEARRRGAVFWTAYIAWLVVFYTTVTFAVVPRPPSKMGMHWPAAGQSGLCLGEVAHIFGLALAMGAAITAAQDLAWPLIGAARRGEKVFFFSSVASRVAFLAVLGYHHYGAAAAAGEGLPRRGG
jgi:hypothetical protein